MFTPIDVQHAATEGYLQGGEKREAETGGENVIYILYPCAAFMLQQKPLAKQLFSSAVWLCFNISKTMT